MEVDAAGSSSQLPVSQPALEEQASLLRHREQVLRSMQDALEARRQDLEAQFAEREAALLERESQNEDLRQANERLVMATLTAQELREAAQMARRRQEEFLAMLAHELRNPLAPIRTAVEILAKLDGKPIPSTLLEILRRQIRHLVRLVDDLLDVSRVNEGKVILQRRTTAVADFVQHAVDTCREAIEGRQQRLSVDLGSAPLFVDGDPVRLTQIVSNLLQNACKYTPETGQISVQARRHGEGIEISVADKGNGISAELLPHIFDLFTQDERQLSRVQGGLGIGLTVVRRLAEMHGGTVEARSDGRDLGSEFIVRLPAAAQPTAEGPGPTQVVTILAPIQARILIIEDNVDAATTLASLLRLSGHDVDISTDGLSGLERFEKTKPQVVLCDIGLPGLDGYGVAAQMRKAQHDPRPALFAITGYGDAMHAERAQSAGFDYHVVKPVHPEALLRLIDAAMRVEDWSTSGFGVITSHGSLREDDRAR